MSVHGSVAFRRLIGEILLAFALYWQAPEALLRVLMETGEIGICYKILVGKTGLAEAKYPQCPAEKPMKETGKTEDVK